MTLQRSKKRIDQIKKRYYIDKNNRIIKETRLNNVTIAEVVSSEEIEHLVKLRLDQIGENHENHS